MIKLICVGRLKEPHYQAAAAEYMKRLSRYGRTETAEIRECTDKNPEVAKRKEAELILERIPQSSYVVALDRSGRQRTSEEFSKLLKMENVAFIIGGPVGLSQEVLDESDAVLSLSELTFPHQLARILLLEQIYRAATILEGGPYHK